MVKEHNIRLLFQFKEFTPLLSPTESNQADLQYNKTLKQLERSNHSKFYPCVPPHAIFNIVFLIRNNTQVQSGSEPS